MALALAAAQAAAPATDQRMSDAKLAAAKQHALEQHAALEAVRVAAAAHKCEACHPAASLCCQQARVRELEAATAEQGMRADEAAANTAAERQHMAAAERAAAALEAQVRELDLCAAGEAAAQASRAAAAEAEAARLRAQLQAARDRAAQCHARVQVAHAELDWGAADARLDWGAADTGLGGGGGDDSSLASNARSLAASGTAVAVVAPPVVSGSARQGAVAAAQLRVRVAELEAALAAERERGAMAALVAREAVRRLLADAAHAAQEGEAARRALGSRTAQLEAALGVAEERAAAAEVAAVEARRAVRGRTAEAEREALQRLAKLEAQLVSHYACCQATAADTEASLLRAVRANSELEQRRGRERQRWAAVRRRYACRQGAWRQLAANQALLLRCFAAWRARGLRLRLAEARARTDRAAAVAHQAAEEGAWQAAERANLHARARAGLTQCASTSTETPAESEPCLLPPGAEEPVLTSRPPDRSSPACSPPPSGEELPAAGAGRRDMQQLDVPSGLSDLDQFVSATSGLDASPSMRNSVRSSAGAKAAAANALALLQPPLEPAATAPAEPALAGAAAAAELMGQGGPSLPQELSRHRSPPAKRVRGRAGAAAAVGAAAAGVAETARSAAGCGEEATLHTAARQVARGATRLVLAGALSASPWVPSSRHRRVLEAFGPRPQGGRGGRGWGGSRHMNRSRREVRNEREAELEPDGEVAPAQLAVAAGEEAAGGGGTATPPGHARAPQAAVATQAPAAQDDGKEDSGPQPRTVPPLALAPYASPAAPLWDQRRPPSAGTEGAPCPCSVRRLAVGDEGRLLVLCAFPF